MYFVGSGKAAITLLTLLNGDFPLRTKEWNLL